MQNHPIRSLLNSEAGNEEMLPKVGSNAAPFLSAARVPIRKNPA